MKKVEILLATYRPNMNYLEQQLKSLNSQSYTNIILSVRDDSADEEWFHRVSSSLKDNINSFKYSIFKNAKNLGSNATFGLLTEYATGDILAYCDQDDVWENNKIETLVTKLEKENAVLCYCDLSIMDKNSLMSAKSITNVSFLPKWVYGHGETIFPFFIRRNCVTGCAMIISANVAKKALPFPEKKYYIHDQWLALSACFSGSIAFINQPLVRYRVYEGQQVGINGLKNIDTRKNYVKNKLCPEKERYAWLLEYNDYGTRFKCEALRMLNYTEKRIVLFNNITFSNFIAFLPCVSLGLRYVGELIIALSPPLVADLCLQLYHKIAGIKRKHKVNICM